MEQAHIDGVFPCTGMARVCGLAEAVGRAVWRYRPVKIDVPIAEGDVLPLWGGLRVVHLTGDTLGHCGFHSVKHDLLFSGDLWARVLMRTQVSPAIFTSVPEHVWPSMKKARALRMRWVVPGHYDLSGGMRITRRFEEFCADRERHESGECS